MNGANDKLKDFKDRIVRDAEICGGEPVFKGTRVTLRTVLASFVDFRALQTRSLEAHIRNLLRRARKFTRTMMHLDSKILKFEIAPNRMPT